MEAVNKLEKLIPEYAERKEQENTLKKLNSADNEEIKTLMAELREDKHSAGGYTVSISTREDAILNEDKLLEYLKSQNIPKESGIIKTKEYIDMDALEKAIYNKSISKEIIIGMDNCKTSKTVTTLRVKKDKKKKEADE